MQIAIDFDGTIVDHAFPEIGLPNPGAIEWMKRFIEAGADLILYTMRSDARGTLRDPEAPERAYLTEAVDHCKKHGIEFFGINTNPTQDRWTSSPKAYAQLYIDDMAFGCPLRDGLERPMVDWAVVGPAVLERLQSS